MHSDRKEQFFRCCPDCGALMPYFRSKCDCGRHFQRPLPRNGRLLIAAAIILSVSLAFAVYYIFWQREALPLQYVERISPFIAQKEEAAYNEGYKAAAADYAAADERVEEGGATVDPKAALDEWKSKWEGEYAQPSDFLTEQALKEAREVDAEYGPGAYGGTAWVIGQDSDNPALIRDMDVDEILEYLQDYTGSRYWGHEEVCNIFVYAFQRGYENARAGVWNDMTEEYIDGYEFSGTDAALYRELFEFE